MPRVPAPSLALLLPLLLLPTAGMAAPADLAPGAPELQAAEARLEELLGANRAVATATKRLHEAWALPPWVAPPPPPPPKPGARPVDPSRDVVPLTHIPRPPLDGCADVDRLRLGWAAERFGAAWRESAQAVQAEAERVLALQRAPTISPLLDQGWGARLDARTAAARAAVRDFREASAWQAIYVRPALERCPVPELVPAPGHGRAPVAAEGESAPRVAVLGLGDGWVCPGPHRAEDAVVLLPIGEACWSEATPCACSPAPALPGAVVGRPVEPIEAEAAGEQGAPPGL